MKASVFKSVKARLLIIAIVPLILFMGLLLNLIAGYYSLSRDMEILEPTTRLSVQIGLLLHETQKERGMTAGLLSGAEAFRETLNKQRQLVDKQRNQVKDIISGMDSDQWNARLKQAIDSALHQMGKIDTAREKVDSQRGALDEAVDEAIRTYTATNNAMVQVVKTAASLAIHEDTRRLRTVYVNLLQLKEKAGQERAVLSTVFSLDYFTGDSLGGFSRLISEQDSFTDAFLSLATEEEADYFNQEIVGTAIAAVADYRQEALSKLGNQDKARLLTRLYENIGYGGAIHQFKNLVLRQDFKYEKRFTSRYAEITAILDRLEVDPNITAAEKEHLIITRKTIDLYKEATRTAAKMISNGASISEVDKIIKINDGPAIKAMAALSTSATLGNFKVDPKSWFDAATRRIDLLKNVEDHLSAKMSMQGKELGASAKQNFILISLVSLVIIAIVMAAIFLVLRSILNPLRKTTHFARQLAQGDLMAKIDFSADDEIGELTKALNTMVDSFRTSVEQVVGAIQKLMLTAEQTSTITEQTNTSVQTQLAETTKMADAIKQMNAMAKDVSQNTNDASTATNEANQEATTGKSSMEATVSQIRQLSSELQSSAVAISKLEQDSIEIGTVLDVIKGISEQTNLLALNAAIEAARAGEQGRGFAVVADEVRTLASRTQNSAEEISQMINKLQEGARDAVAAINRGGDQAQKSVEQAVATGENLSAISNVVSRINDMSGQIASAVIEQGSVVEKINQNIGHINTMAQQTAGYSRETESASNDLTSLTNALRESASQFKIN